jgi:hypothetical protein
MRIVVFQALNTSVEWGLEKNEIVDFQPCSSGESRERTTPLLFLSD